MADQSLADVGADTLFSAAGTMLAEYPLCAHDLEDIKIWGAMPADLLYVSADNRSIVIIENKIGSRFTSGGAHVELGQLARQAEYLCRWKERRGLASASLVLLTSAECLRTMNYSRVFETTLAHTDRGSRVQGYVLRWEDIFNAVGS
ncbi:MAG: hypothetical protein KIT14_19075 [bacterium]|nr:hypothetical protein [bacterium]